MSPTCFWRSSFWEVIAAIEGQRMREERIMQSLWEMFRFSAFYSMLPYSKKGGLKKPSDIAEFPWDIKPPKLDKKAVSSLFERIKERDTKESKSKVVIAELPK